MHISGSGTAHPPVRVVWDDSLLDYNFGPGHPMSPIRLDLTRRLAFSLGLLSLPHVETVGAVPADDDTLCTVHAREYLAAVRLADSGRPDPRRGLGSEDVPIFAGMHDAAARLVDGSHRGARAIIEGEALRVVNFAGGMHHAMRNKAAGFCVYNDCAVAIQAFLDAGFERVLYVDIDAHHGDGTQQLFWDDSRVATVSIHESGASLFPGTGHSGEVGGRKSQGYAVNLPLPAGTGDKEWLRAFHAVVPAVAESFRPQVIVSQHGCDGHRDDPLSNLTLSVEALGTAAQAVRDLAASLCGGRWLATGGGGYAVWDVVPRVWSHLISVAADVDVPFDTPLPQLWLDHVEPLRGRAAPRFLGDGAQLWWKSWEMGYDPSHPVDRAIMATRKETFPHHGLDPWFD